ncbi:UTP--glucose-1-phosphate uridylyltransferase [Salipaludibacillus sp. HK11]|uniref:UTP--glucose-1-phosphate uridylyltransferase n=1 Tax=Salipaludibacillus sp. HK11 TaxID=3394320 RepID=UPI0039FCB5F1
MSIRKAIIPAAGYGTRNLPVTKSLPKEMFPINNRPAIQFIVEEAVACGIEEILIVFSRSKNILVDYFDRSIELEEFLKKNKKLQELKKLDLPNVTIQFIRQPYALGLGDAIKQGESFIGGEPFAVLLPDDLFVDSRQIGLSRLIKKYEVYQTNMIGVLQVANDKLNKYGVIKGKYDSENMYEILDIIEKPKTPPSNLAVIGRYVFHPDIFSYLKQLTPSLANEIQLTDAIKNMLLQQNAYAIKFNEKRYDISDSADYIAINNYFLQKNKD